MQRLPEPRFRSGYRGRLPSLSEKLRPVFAERLVRDWKALERYDWRTWSLSRSQARNALESSKAAWQEPIPKGKEANPENG
ncbi:MAG: hypothetical protein IT210_07860 [Armatimonadetes bacterium]|nr:hypothetical protein [Armatimonadota bacterium]